MDVSAVSAPAGIRSEPPVSVRRPPVAALIATVVPRLPQAPTLKSTTAGMSRWRLLIRLSYLSSPDKDKPDPFTGRALLGRFGVINGGGGGEPDAHLLAQPVWFDGRRLGQVHPALIQDLEEAPLPAQVAGARRGDHVVKKA